MVKVEAVLSGLGLQVVKQLFEHGHENPGAAAARKILGMC